MTEPDALLDRVVSAAEEGQRADVVLSTWLGEPRSRAQQRITAGQVTVDGAPAAKSQRLRAGERVVVSAPPPPPPSEPPPPVPVRYEDEHLAVVAKPAGLVVHEGAGTGTSATLVDALLAAGMPLSRAGDPERPGIVHRLDRGTSGLLVVAKTDEAFRGLSALFRRHGARRVYTAIVDGVPTPPRATIDAPIARSPRHRTRYTVSADGRPAVSHYDVEEGFGRAALVTVRLESGRTHQVRVHLASIGHPVSGDVLYGASRALAAELGLTRPALHARHLSFPHPITGAEVAVDEPPPADVEAALAVLRGG